MGENFQMIWLAITKVVWSLLYFVPSFFTRKVFMSPKVINFYTLVEWVFIVIFIDGFIFLMLENSLITLVELI